MQEQFTIVPNGSSNELEHRESHVREELQSTHEVDLRNSFQRQFGARQLQ